MNLQRGFTTPLLVLLIILPVLGFYLGTQHQRDSSINSQTNSEDCQKQLSTKEDEILACINNQPQIIVSENEVYEYKNVGIYSSLFENKTFEKKQYNYKRELITERRLKLEDGEIKLGVTIFEYSDRKGTSNGPTNPLVYFGSYEDNQTYHVSELLSSKQTYTTAKNIKMHWSDDSFSGYVNRRMLNFYTQYGPARPVLVQIWATADFGSESLLLELRKKVQATADTIEDVSMHH